MYAGVEVERGTKMCYGMNLLEFRMIDLLIDRTIREILPTLQGPEKLIKCLFCHILAQCYGVTGSEVSALGLDLGFITYR